MSEPITNLSDAVGELGALPVPVGPEPHASRRQSRTMLDHARDALRARMTKDNLRLVLENVVTYAASLEARVAALEAERHETNEALDDAVQELRSREARSADRLTALLAPSQALREEQYESLHHDYRVGRDLPEAGEPR